MTHVAVPSDLSHRLMAALTDAASTDSISKATVAQPRPRNSWSRAFNSAAVAGLLCVAAWSTPAQSSCERPPLLSPAGMSCHAFWSSPPTICRAASRILDQFAAPSMVKSLKGRVITGLGKQMNLADLRLSPVVFPLDVRSTSGDCLIGRGRFVDCRSRDRRYIDNEVPASVRRLFHLEAVVQYSPQKNVCGIAWAENDVVYILAFRRVGVTVAGTASAANWAEQCVSLAHARYLSISLVSVDSYRHSVSDG